MTDPPSPQAIPGSAASAASHALAARLVLAVLTNDQPALARVLADADPVALAFSTAALAAQIAVNAYGPGAPQALQRTIATYTAAAERRPDK